MTISRSDLMTNIYIDIETAPLPLTDQERLDGIAAVKAPARYKKIESIEKWLEENAEAQFEQDYRKGSLNALAGQIVSLAWAFDDDDIEVSCQDSDAYASGDDRNILWDFFQDIFDHQLEKKNTGDWGYTFVGHNVIDFDLRFIAQRCILKKVQPSVAVPMNARHGSGRVFDTMREWAGYRGTVKLDTLAKAFGIQSKSMDGSGVFDLCQNGMWKELAAYNLDDVRITREVYKRMKY
tara:strand:+ start:1629 stop:2339 length:711 start_codon:yes stop_codon:yes gene_type:complete